MFNSRKVKTVKVIREGEDIFVKAHIFKSFTPATNNGITRPAVVLFRNGAPMKGHCQCSVGLSGLCCHVICLLIFLEHYTSHRVKFIALTCTQKIQKWHRKGVTKQTELCHVPLSSLRNVRSSRKTLGSSCAKRKVNFSNDQALTDELVEKSDWSKRDVNEMVSRLKTGIQETGVNVESHIYDQLKTFDVKSGLFQQLHYNYNYRLKDALQDHNYGKDCWYDEEVLKPKFSVNNGDVWHAPLLLDNNITEDLNNEDHQLVTVMLAPAEDQYVPSAPVTKNQPMYEHETVNVYVKQLEGIVEAAKGNLVIEEGENTQEKGTTKENKFKLFVSVPPMEEVNPFGFNCHDIKQNTQVWFDLRIGKVTCSIIGYLAGLAGEKEHLHYLTCIKNKIDPNKVKPRKFASFTRGQQFESEDIKAFVSETKLPVTSCGFFTHPNDNKYRGGPDDVGPGFLLEVKTSVAGSDGPLMAITAHHLLQTNYQMAMTGATIVFLQSYHPEKKTFNTFLIQKNILLLTVTKTIIDHMITEHVITEWPHEENKLLKKLGELNFGQVPNFQSMKPLRS
ncbi:uncharacterized protein LOC122949663 [Acropora millepora]|uniref:uncharacterized protein LOC122949663 n=1 Tax=Acropora millepora TaxID=45264 RepID=UPI001CF101AB|nr:uncharacterized protein LOC122949663 [Acropora millepora]